MRFRPSFTNWDFLSKTSCSPAIRRFTASGSCTSKPCPRAGWVSLLLLEWLRNAVQPPGSRTHIVKPVEEVLVVVRLRDLSELKRLSVGETDILLHPPLP